MAGSICKVVFVLLMLTIVAGCSTKKKQSINPEIAEGERPEAATSPPPAVAIRNTSRFHSVEIKQMKFEPAVLHLHAGDTVLWINHDITDHDITEEIHKSWSSSKLPAGKSWSTVIRRSADYFCSIHVVMKGKLVVE